MMTPDFHTHNRERLGARLKGGVAVLSAHSEMQRGLDSAFGFEQEANFWYLTGVAEPDWWVIIDSSKNRSWLVSPDIDEMARVFDGGLSPEGAISISGVSSVITRKEAATLLKNLARAHDKVYSLGDLPGVERFTFTLNPATRVMWQHLGGLFKSVEDLRTELSHLRAIKCPEEVAAIKEAVGLTQEAFEFVRSGIDGFEYEYEIEAEFTHYFRSRGARGHAYDPIVAAGKNACTLHYSQNNSRLVAGQMILIDVGVRAANGYVADITRTYAYGELNSFSNAVHSEVRQAHEAITKLLRPGLGVAEYQSQVDKIMKQALVNLKLIKSTSDDHGYRQYFPHAISHGLGVDVHDPLGRPESFAPGMVLTVEPGIYIPASNIGVRIEDNILITETGHENLSGSLSTGV